MSWILTRAGMRQRDINPEDWTDEEEDRVYAIRDFLNNQDITLGDFPDGLGEDTLVAIDVMCGGYVMDDFSLCASSWLNNETGEWHQHRPMYTYTKHPFDAPAPVSKRTYVDY